MSPKINVYLPDELAAEVKASGIPVSAVCQQALADAVAQAQTGWPAPGVAAAAGPPGSTDPAGGDLAQNFTKRAYGVLEEAGRTGDGATTVDLVAALTESGGLAVIVLEAADIDPADLATELRNRGNVQTGARPGPLADAAERAVEQARGLGHGYVGTEHLLLALTAGPTRELTRTTLKDMGLDHEQALHGVATALSAYSYARETLTFAGISAPIRAALEDIRTRLGRLEQR